jgi:pilus assembly protein Flp/PilA
MIANKKHRRKGQGATEYVIILVLVAIGSIAVISLFGEQLRGLFLDSTDVLGGKESQDRTVDTSSETAKKTLQDFD